MPRRFLLATLAIVYVLAVPVHAQDQPTPWKAGAAKIIITPEQPIWMSGYGGRTKPAQGKLTELWAKALVLEDAMARRAVLVTLDLVGIDRELSQAICRQLEKQHKLDRAAIILASSHTHSGPVVGNNLRPMYFLDADQEQKINAYTKTLTAKIAQAVDEAVKNLTPARLQWNIGLATFAVNRRNNKEKDVPDLIAQGTLAGPVDHDVPVLSVRNQANQLLAIVFGYACHATVLDGYDWCGDYPGYAQTWLEKEHPGAVALFWAGCGGDQNPLPRRKVTLAEEYGQQLGQAVKAALRRPMNTLPPALTCQYEETPLALAELPTRDQLAKDALSDNKYVASRAKFLLEKIAQGTKLAATYPYPVQIWNLGGELTWVTLGGEVVVDYALRLKKELDPGRTWVMGYANDVMAYIPSLRVLKEGGYEGGGAMLYYGLPTIWSPRVEETILQGVHRLHKKTLEK